MSDHETDTSELEAAIVSEMGDDTTDAQPEPEPEPEDEPEQEDEPEPEDAAHLVMAKLDKYHDRAIKYLAKNMSEVLGDAATEYLECPACNFYNTPGFLHKSPCPPELLGFVYEWTNTTAPDEYLPDTASRVCDACNGLGSVRTGSKVGGRETLPCIACAGNGWVPVGPERESTTMYVGNGSQPMTATPADSAAPAITAAQKSSPEAEALRAQGFIVIDPIATGA